MESFIFGGNTGMQYNELKRRREIAEQFAKPAGVPRNAMEGLHSIADALISRHNSRKASAIQQQLVEQLAGNPRAVAEVLGVPAYRRGTTNHPGGFAVVGEAGPELVNLPQGAQVFPNNGFGSAIAPQMGVQVAENETTKTDEMPYGDAKLTEGQSKDIGYFRRGMSANMELSDPGLETALTQFTDNFAGNFGGVGRLFQDEGYQRAKRAADEFLAMVLRKDTGAAVTAQEFDLYGPVYIPMPGDKPEVIAAKRNAREQFLKGLEMGFGTAAPLAEAVKSEVGPDQMSDDEYLKSLGLD
jgi:hypothetical protein